MLSCRTIRRNFHLLNLLHFSIAFFLLTNYPGWLKAQQSTSTRKRPIGEIKLSVDDDFFDMLGHGTDRNYTWGTEIGLYFSNIGTERFLSKLLIKDREESDNLSFVSLHHCVYTPANLRSHEVVNNDRPYAAAMYVSRGRQSFNNDQGQKISSEISLGVIGPWAFGKQVQTTFHKLIG